MQEIYQDGSEGPVKPFVEMQQLMDSLEKKNVDHVRVFNKDTGNKVKHIGRNPGKSSRSRRK